MAYNFEKIGKNAIGLLDYFASLTSLVYYSIIELFKRNRKGRKFIWNITRMQILFTGYDALPLVGTIAVIIGGLLIVIAATGARALGQAQIVNALITILIREVGPIMVAIIVVARSGTAIVIEIGNMTVNHELEAIETLGIDPLRFIVLPRIIGMMISIMTLVIYFGLFGLFGGFAVQLLVGSMNIPGIQLDAMTFQEFFRIFFSVFTVGDVLIILVKSIILGAYVSVICLYHGFKVGNTPTMVPVAAIKAVVNSFLFTFGINLALTGIFLSVS